MTNDPGILKDLDMAGVNVGVTMNQRLSTYASLWQRKDAGIDRADSDDARVIFRPLQRGQPFLPAA